MKSQIYEFPDQFKVQQEAAQWLALLDREEPPTAKELEQLRLWMARSPVHAKEIQSLNRFWGNNVLTALMVPIGQYDANKMKTADLVSRWILSKKLFLFPAVAFCLATILIITQALIVVDPYAELNDTYYTAVGEQYLLPLPDGSSVRLNTDTEIEIRYSNQLRAIHLVKGEAFFEVAQILERPFQVYANGGLVQAVGTAFSVRATEANYLKVLVTEGSVSVAEFPGSDHRQQLFHHGSSANTDSDSGEPSDNRDLAVQIVKAGHEIILDTHTPALEDPSTPANNGEVIPVSPREMERRQAWFNGVLRFSGAPLEEVIKEVSRYTTTKIEIADPRLTELEIGGRMLIGDVSTLLEILTIHFDIQVTQLDESHIQLTTRSK